MAPTPRRNSPEQGVLASVSPPLYLQVILVMVLTQAIAGGLNFLAAWGLVPGLDIETVSSGLATALSTGLMTLIGGLWSAWVVRRSKVVDAGVTMATAPGAPREEKQLVIDATADMAEVKKIEVTSKSIADAGPENVVQK